MGAVCSKCHDTGLAANGGGDPDNPRIGVCPACPRCGDCGQRCAPDCRHGCGEHCNLPRCTVASFSADLVEVPAAAYEAALGLLRRLAAAGEIEVGQRCPLCHVEADDLAVLCHVHTAFCPVGLARVVRDALDYTSPERQAAALEQLRRAG